MAEYGDVGRTRESLSAVVDDVRAGREVIPFVPKRGDFKAMAALFKRIKNITKDADGLAGVTFEWDAEIINEIPNELLAWRSLENSEIDHAGSVHFEAHQDGGSKVTVIMEYRPPAGKLGAGIARIFGQEPAQVIDKDLNGLKQLMESGEITSAHAQPHGGGA